jgi:hypothetical protein
MGCKKRTYKIRENPTLSPPFEIVSNGRVLDLSVPIRFNKDRDRMRKVDHYRIRFDIANFGNSRYRFVPDKDDVFWVQEGTTCPHSRGNGLPGVIWVDEVDKDGEWIDVINMNMHQLRFQFTLNFVDKTIQNPTPADYVELDPGGGNENGGGGGSDLALNSLAIIGLGIAAGLASFFGASLLLA